eukprot:TRINITY_DN71567_c0_g1_i1.p1 TRINITY_DN71567_c0_g1~~TRINITY_DN71567_c0_g1_i1.p1  ORF type:complete len:350 (+),score=77.10 TRINITY_DN71567_c0_g1_i1:74-1051(+)
MSGSLDELAVQPGGVAAALDAAGVAVVRGVLTPECCAAALAMVTEHHAAAAAAEEAGCAEKRWFSQRYPHRDDILLPCDRPAVRGCLTLLLGGLSGALREALGAGAVAQDWHTDHPWTPVRQVVTCFCALSDVSPCLGPTELLLGTHAAPSHPHGCAEGPCPADGTRCSRAARRVALTLQRGDVALMDARLLHRGGSRRDCSADEAPRTLFYITLQRQGTSYGTEHSPSILPEYAGRFRLSDWHEWTSADHIPPAAAHGRLADWLDAAAANAPQAGVDCSISSADELPTPGGRSGSASPSSCRTPPTPPGAVAPADLPGPAAGCG